MNAIELLTREKLNRQYFLDKCRDPEFDQYVKGLPNEIPRELANIERALETSKAEARRKAGVG